MWTPWRREHRLSRSQMRDRIDVLNSIVELQNQQIALAGAGLVDAAAASFELVEVIQEQSSLLTAFGRICAAHDPCSVLGKTAEDGEDYTCPGCGNFYRHSDLIQIGDFLDDTGELEITREKYWRLFASPEAARSRESS